MPVVQVHEWMPYNIAMTYSVVIVGCGVVLGLIAVLFMMAERKRNRY